MNPADRWNRYRELPGLHDMLSADIGIVGVGAVGREVALGLAIMGASHLWLYDPDIVNPINLGTQGYEDLDVGSNKVLAVHRSITRVNPNCAVGPNKKSYPFTDCPIHAVLFVCCDTMDARFAIKERALPKQLLIDTRVGGLVARVIQDPRKSCPGWRKTLFKDDEAFDAPCALRMTRYIACVAAYYAIAEFQAAVRDKSDRSGRDILIDMLARTLTSSPLYVPTKRKAASHADHSQSEVVHQG
jgi:sulfur carrier protein ThiS adenylyltransferase